MTRSGRARAARARTDARDGGDEATREDSRLTEIRGGSSTAQVGSSDVRVQDARDFDEARDRDSRGIQVHGDRGGDREERTTDENCFCVRGMRAVVEDRWPR